MDWIKLKRYLLTALLSVLIFSFFCSLAWGQPTIDYESAPLSISDSSGSVVGFPYNLVVPDNSLTSSGGIVTLSYLHLVDVPASPTSYGTINSAAVSTGFFYIVVAQNHWQRVAIADWVQGFLLQESGDYLLQESGDKIIL